MEMVNTKKHPCPDCVDCLWCADTRCSLCLKSACPKKLTFQEQIALYEKINSGKKDLP